MNFIERYVKFAEPLTEAPRQFHYYMAYMLLSCAVNRRAWYSGAGSFDISPNLWFILIGPSSITKKSTMLNIALRHILAHTNIEFEKYPQGGSQENFLETLSEKPMGIIAHSEFMSFMDWVNRDYNAGLVSILSDIFDQPPLVTRSVGTRGKRTDYRIEKPFVNIATVTNIEWMNDCLKETKIIGGFIPRFNLILSNDDEKSIPETPEPNEQLRKELIWELENINTSTFGKMTYDPQAKKANNEWYNEFKDKFIRGAPANLVPCLDRRRSDLHKFAMLNCIMRNEGKSCNVMNLEDFSKAVDTIANITNFTTQVICDKITYNQYQSNRQKIIEMVKKIAGTNGGCPHSVLLRVSKIKGKDLRDHMEDLVEDGTITTEQDKSGARIKILYHINEKDGQDENNS